MQMRMVQQVLSPGVKHAQEADFSAEMGRIGSDGLQGLGGGVEQDVVDGRFVLESDGSDFVWYCEHDVEVLGVEQFRAAVGQPLCTSERLAFWAVPVTT